MKFEVSEFSAYWYYRNIVIFNMSRGANLQKYSTILFTIFKFLFLIINLLLKKQKIIKSLTKGYLNAFLAKI